MQASKLNVSDKDFYVVLAVTKQLHVLIARRAYRTANLYYSTLPRPIDHRGLSKESIIRKEEENAADR